MIKQIRFRMVYFLIVLADEFVNNRCNRTSGHGELCRFVGRYQTGNFGQIHLFGGSVYAGIAYPFLIRIRPAQTCYVVPYETLFRSGNRLPSSGRTTGMSYQAVGIIRMGKSDACITRTNKKAVIPQNPQ